MVRGLLLGVLVVVAGCDRVFGLAAHASGGDATATDGVTHICPQAVGHDEDGDGIDDACDDCPTVIDPSQEDTGDAAARTMGDGVGDACDPAPALGGDAIVLFQPFLDVTGFRTGGSVSFGVDMVSVGGEFSFIASNANFVLTQLAADISFVNPQISDQTVQLSANSGGFRCVVSTTPCGTEAGCLTAQGITSASVSCPASELTSVRMTAEGGAIVCTAAAGSACTIGVPATFQEGQVAVYTVSANAFVNVKNMIAYGRP